MNVFLLFRVYGHGFSNREGEVYKRGMIEGKLATAGKEKRTAAGGAGCSRRYGRSQERPPHYIPMDPLTKSAIPSSLRTLQTSIIALFGAFIFLIYFMKKIQQTKINNWLQFYAAGTAFAGIFFNSTVFRGYSSNVPILFVLVFEFIP